MMYDTPHLRYRVIMRQRVCQLMWTSANTFLFARIHMYMRACMDMHKYVSACVNCYASYVLMYLSEEWSAL